MKKLFILMCMAFVYNLTYATIDCTTFDLVEADDNSLVFNLPISPDCNTPLDYDFKISYRINGSGNPYLPLGNYSIVFNYVAPDWIPQLSTSGLAPCTGYDFLVEIFCNKELVGGCYTNLSIPFTTTGCSPTLIIGDVIGCPGDIVSVPVTLEDIPSSLTGLQFRITFSSEWGTIDYQSSDFLPTINWEHADNFNAATNTYNYVGLNQDGLGADLGSTFAIVNINIMIPDDASGCITTNTWDVEIIDDTPDIIANNIVEGSICASEDCCDSNSAFATILSQDACCVIYELTFNCSGEDWTFCPDFPNGDCYSGSPNGTSTVITHHYDSDGTYQWWFDQDNNGNSGSVTVEDCCDSNSAFATVVSIDECCVVYELNFNCSGEDWTFCPDYPNGQCYSGSAPADGGSTIITHHYDSNGTYQWWFDQDNNGNSGSVTVEDCECEGPELTCEALIPCKPPIWVPLSTCNITICKGSYTRLRVKPTGNQYTYEWTGTLPGNVPWKTKKITTPSEYSVTVTDNTTGCSSTITFTVNVIDCGRSEETCGVALLGDSKPTDVIPRLEGETPSISANIYPNPANDYVTFEIGALEATNAQITLMSSTGKIIRNYNQALNTGTTQLRINDLNILATGVYLYQIRVGDGVKYGKLLIE